MPLQSSDYQQVFIWVLYIESTWLNAPFNFSIRLFFKYRL